MRRAVLTLVGMALGCACGEEPDATPRAMSRPSMEGPAPERSEQVFGEIVLTPSSDLAEYAAHWAERWSAATGRVISVGTDGHAIVSQDEVLNANGKRLCGGTRLSTGIMVARIQAATCPGMYETLGHELGHLLGADGHAGTGIMSVSSAPQPIDDAALDLVCANMACPGRNPEH